jgi:ribosomal protein S18 acetylase RimI-like enzyme
VNENVIRPAAPADFDAVGRLTVEAYRADGQLADEADGYGEVLADVAGRAAEGEVLVAVDPSGTVVGAVTFTLPGTRYAQLAGPGEAEFRMLAVDPGRQGNGVGELLVWACVERAGQTGASAVIICSRDFATAAQRLYARLGFVRVPERDWSPMPGVNLLALRLALRRT